MTRTPLRFNAFVMNTNSHIHHGQWQRPEAQQTEFTDVNTWINLARILEDAKFDAMFFADVVGHYGDADSSPPTRNTRGRVCRSRPTIPPYCWEPWRW